MKNSCESYPKKLARALVWETMGVRPDAKVAVLAGPDNGDARHLRARGHDVSKIVCVDMKEANLLAARESFSPRIAGDSRRRGPQPKYARMGFLTALQLEGPFDAFFLDGCAIASEKTVAEFVSCLEHVPDGAPVAVAFAYGRWVYAGPKPDWMELGAEHWRNYVRRQLGAASFRCTRILRYKGKQQPMLVFVGTKSSVQRFPMPIPIPPKPLAKMVTQQLAFVLSKKLGPEYPADWFCVSRGCIAAWRAVRTRTSRILTTIEIRVLTRVRRLFSYFTESAARLKEQHRTRQLRSEWRAEKAERDAARKRDPVQRARHALNMKVWSRVAMEDPHVQDRVYANARRNHLKRMKNPEYRAHRAARQRAARARSRSVT